MYFLSSVFFGSHNPLLTLFLLVTTDKNLFLIFWVFSDMTQGKKCFRGTNRSSCIRLFSRYFFLNPPLLEAMSSGNHNVTLCSRRQQASCMSSFYLKLYFNCNAQISVLGSNYVVKMIFQLSTPNFFNEAEFEN